MLNPRIQPMFKTENDQIENILFEAHEEWIVQDQALFTLLLSTISESLLHQVLSCKHTREVWDNVHKHYNAHMNARVHQLHEELKMSNIS